MSETTLPPPAPAPFHGGALTVWLLAALLPSVLTSNPVILGTALALIAWTHRRVARSSAAAAAWSSFARFAFFFVGFTLVFNVLLGGAGETVLLELPAWTVRGDDGATIFRLGGPVTLESVAAGTIRAMALLSVILALATFNSLVDHAQLLRGLPRWLDQAGTVVTIAIAFMPQLVTAQREVREALALRGHRMRKLRDFLPLVLILLAEALDRAMALAESMEARGYAGPPLPASRRDRPRWLIAGGLLLIGCGAILGGFAGADDATDRQPFTDSSRLWPWLAVAAGVGAVVWALRQVGRRNRRTRYRREPWRPRDSVLAALSGSAGLLLLALFVWRRELFVYPIFPRLGTPPVRWEVLLPLAAILGPLLGPALHGAAAPGDGGSASGTAESDQ